MRLLDRMKCWWSGHAWDDAYGYRNHPNPGATCMRCGLKLKDNEMEG